MTNAPYLLPGARAGYRMGDQKVVDAMMFDGLWDAFDNVAMGAGTEGYTKQKSEITRERQDAFAAASHERAAAAIKDGKFADEITPVSVPQRKGDPVVIDTDEGVRPGTTVESLGRAAAGVRQGRHDHRRQRQPDLRRRGGRDRHVQAAAARARASTPLGEVVGYGQVAGPDTSLLTQPSRATTRALERAGLASSDVDLFEFNEAFAAVGLASMDDLGLSEDVVNVNGGAIALGHPIGMSGTRLALDPAARTEAAGRRTRRRRLVRWRRPGRRPRHHYPLAARPPAGRARQAGWAEKPGFRSPVRTRDKLLGRRLSDLPSSPGPPSAAPPK